MERLSGLDAAFLGMETPSAHMHVLGVAVLDPSSAPEGCDVERVRRLVEARMDLVPAFRRRLVSVPLGLHSPLWAEDPHFDLDYHVRRVAVPVPGGPDELADFVAAVASRPLDRAKPLWKLWFVEGLEGGHVAVIAKIHHAAIDGAAGIGILAALFDTEPDAPLVREALGAAGSESAVAGGERIPSELELVAHALGALARQPVALVRNLGRLGGSGVRLARRLLGEPMRVAAPLTAPRLAMNGSITPHRKVAFARVALADVKAVKRAFDVTVNDVVLTVVAGALRAYLDGRGELPDRPLVAAIPMSVRAGDDETVATGNQVSAIFSALDVQIADPAERLHAIHRSTYGGKHVHAELGPRTLAEWAELAAPIWFGRAVRLLSSLHFAEHLPTIINLVVSNVPGPSFPLYLAGARLVSMYPLGPIFDGCGLNVTVISYRDAIDVGFLACRELVPDLDDLADAVPDALAELVKVAPPE